MNNTSDFHNCTLYPKMMFLLTKPTRRNCIPSLHKLHPMQTTFTEASITIAFQQPKTATCNLNINTLEAWPVYPQCIPMLTSQRCLRTIFRLKRQVQTIFYGLKSSSTGGSKANTDNCCLGSWWVMVMLVNNMCHDSAKTEGCTTHQPLDTTIASRPCRYGAKIIPVRGFRTRHSKN